MSNQSAYHRLIPNIFWNLFGFGVPLAVAAYAIPALLGGLGAERFGLLTLAWAVIGYFSFFDLGLSRALTRSAIELLGGQTRFSAVQGTAPLIGTGVLSIFGIGLLCLLVFFFARGAIVDGISITPGLRAEASLAMAYVALGLPLVTLSTAYMGLLEAVADFRAMNLIRSISGVLNFIGPLLFLQHEDLLIKSVQCLVLIRLAACVAYGARVQSHGVRLRDLLAWDGAVFGQLIRFGGWVTVSNLLTPLFAQIDKFVVAVMSPVSGLAQFSVPSEFVSRLGVFPGAVSGVLYPAFTKLSVAKDGALRELIWVSYLFFLSIVGSLYLLLYAYADDIFQLWLGKLLQGSEVPVFRILVVGFLVNSLARIPFLLLLAVNRPDLTAKFHLLQLPVYIVAMVLLGKAFGLPGLAAAGVLRFSLDFALLLYANQSGRFAFASAHRLGPLRLGQLLALTAAVLAAPILVVELASAASRAPLVALLLLPLLALGWHAAQHLRQRR